MNEEAVAEAEKSGVKLESLLTPKAWSIRLGALGLRTPKEYFIRRFEEDYRIVDEVRAEADERKWSGPAGDFVASLFLPPGQYELAQAEGGVGQERIRWMREEIEKRLGKSRIEENAYVADIILQGDQGRAK